MHMGEANLLQTQYSICVKLGLENNPKPVTQGNTRAREDYNCLTHGARACDSRPEGSGIAILLVTFLLKKSDKQETKKAIRLSEALRKKFNCLFGFSHLRQGK